MKSSSAKNASPPSISFWARFCRSANSASVIVARSPNCFGRSSGVMPLLAHTPWKSGRPSGRRAARTRQPASETGRSATAVADRATPSRMARHESSRHGHSVSEIACRRRIPFQGYARIAEPCPTGWTSATPATDAADRLIDLGALDVEPSPGGGLAALMPDSVTPGEVAAALGTDGVSVSPAVRSRRRLGVGAEPASAPNRPATR